MHGSQIKRDRLTTARLSHAGCKVAPPQSRPRSIRKQLTAHGELDHSALRRRRRRGQDRARRGAAALLDALARWKRGSWSIDWRGNRHRSAGCSAAGRSKEPPIKGLYIHGDVGRGKTMLMDLFFEASPVARKRRVHFHEFMIDVHERVHAFRQKMKLGEHAGEDAIRLAADRAGAKRPGCSASMNSTSPTSPTR